MKGKNYEISLVKLQNKKNMKTPKNIGSAVKKYTYGVNHSSLYHAFATITCGTANSIDCVIANIIRITRMQIVFMLLYNSLINFNSNKMVKKQFF
jgi:hypothetical protein